MAISVTWADGEMQTVIAAIAERAFPELPPEIAATIRATVPPREGSTWIIHLDFNDGQRLKAWCDARRERATEQEPNDTWTRIVARVNEAVQPFAPAKDKEPGSGAGRSGTSL
jgi:hypothetical protein